MVTRVVSEQNNPSRHGRYAALVEAVARIIEDKIWTARFDDKKTELENIFDALTDGRSLPDRPGRWFWEEWSCEVTVYKKRGQRYMYVTPPNGIEVRVSKRLAGGWFALPTDS